MGKLEEDCNGLQQTFIGSVSRAHFPFFKDSIQCMQKELESSLAILHEQFYAEGISVVAPFPLSWRKLAPKFKEFLAATAIFKDF